MSVWLLVRDKVESASRDRRIFFDAFLIGLLYWVTLQFYVTAILVPVLVWLNYRRRTSPVIRAVTDEYSVLHSDEFRVTPTPAHHYFETFDAVWKIAGSCMLAELLLGITFALVGTFIVGPGKGLPDQLVVFVFISAIILMFVCCATQWVFWFSLNHPKYVRIIPVGIIALLFFGSFLLVLVIPALFVSLGFERARCRDVTCYKLAAIHTGGSAPGDNPE